MFKSRFIRLLIVATILLSIGSFAIHSTPQTIIYEPIKLTPRKVVKPDPVLNIFDKSLYSNNDPSGIWIVVNKSRPLTPLTYFPVELFTPNIALRSPGGAASRVSSAIAQPLQELFVAAKSDGLNLMMTSGYRSFTYQTSVYNGYIASIGQTETDKISARPGHSEHQTGFAVDIEPSTHKCALDTCFAATPEGIWLASNAYKYGFIIRYPSDKTDITGYSFEPWHIRYVGIALSTEMHRQGVGTLEEFFNLPGGNTYL